LRIDSPRFRRASEALRSVFTALPIGFASFVHPFAALQYRFQGAFPSLCIIFVFFFAELPQ
jgi:hypothetical protein